ncbi:MAG TPA: S24 family peptidase [Methylophilaceae bacterium]|nr:S24 family peptidase [Methylophilaceae bacterium]
MNANIPLPVEIPLFEDLMNNLHMLISNEPAYAAQSRFASPCQGYEKDPASLVRELITNKPATKLFPVDGYSMVGVGIFHGSILIVNAALDAISESIVLAVWRGKFVVKQLVIGADGVKHLYSRPKNHPGMLLPIGDADEVQVWGVVTHAIVPFI